MCLIQSEYLDIVINALMHMMSTFSGSFSDTRSGGYLLLCQIMTQGP